MKIKYGTLLLFFCTITMNPMENTDKERAVARKKTEEAGVREFARISRFKAHRNLGDQLDTAVGAAGAGQASTKPESPKPQKLTAKLAAGMADAPPSEPPTLDPTGPGAFEALAAALATESAPIGTVESAGQLVASLLSYEPQTLKTLFSTNPELKVLLLRRVFEAGWPNAEYTSSLEPDNLDKGYGQEIMRSLQQAYGPNGIDLRELERIVLTHAVLLPPAERDELSRIYRLGELLEQKEKGTRSELSGHDKARLLLNSKETQTDPEPHRLAAQAQPSQAIALKYAAVSALGAAAGAGSMYLIARK